jgi:RNA polymerase sigma-70 factor (ECF subfamily)
MRSLAEAATFQAVRPAPNPFARHRDPVASGPPGERPVKAQNVQAAGVPVLANTSASEQASAEQERSHGVQRNRSEDGGGSVVDRKGRDALLAAVPSLRAFAMSLTGNVDRADDLVQDTIVRAWSHFDHFKPGTNLHAWLFTILRNLFHSDYRKRKREVEDPNASLAQKVAVLPEQGARLDWADFRIALAKLPHDQREALLLIGAEGFSYDEAARICDVAVGTIKSRVNRARKRLIELLALEGEEFGPDRLLQAALNGHGEPVAH